MSCIGKMVVEEDEEEEAEEEEEEEVFLLGVILRRRTLVVHGIPHQSLHPAVRHGEQPLAQGVMATSPRLRPMNGKWRGKRAWRLPLN